MVSSTKLGKGKKPVMNYVKAVRKFGKNDQTLVNFPLLDASFMFVISHSNGYLPRVLLFSVKKLEKGIESNISLSMFCIVLSFCG